jgi:hypothetical protein
MAELPSYDLELKAANERRRLHEVISEFRSRIREDLDPKKQVREHFLGACGGAAVLMFGLGYFLTGLFILPLTFPQKK